MPKGRGPGDRTASCDHAQVRGELITETFAFDGGRQVTVYVPPSRPQGLVFAGDGQALASWGADLEETGAPPVMVVGVHGSADETRRLHEYSATLDPVRFAAHETFVVHEVRGWVESRFGVALPTERTAVLGVSAGGELALAMGLRHPQVFGAVLCASPGAGYRPPVELPARLPRTYLLAGTGEPFFRENASRWASALANGGADVVMQVRAGAHGDAFWREELAPMVEWAFGG